MNRGIIAKRYARALLSHAIEKGVEDIVYKNMSHLCMSYLEVKEFRNSLIIPVLEDDKKIGLIETACGGTIPDELKQFLLLMLKQKRENLLHSVALIFINLYNEYKNMTICRLTTAQPASEEIINNITALVSGKTGGPVKINNVVNSKIIGGFIFEMNYLRLDASLSTQLETIKRELTSENANYHLL
jgi:F-type H+-transporting ATPase subunit delta